MHETRGYMQIKGERYSWIGVRKKYYCKKKTLTKVKREIKQVEIHHIMRLKWQKKTMLAIIFQLLW